MGRKRHWPPTPREGPRRTLVANGEPAPLAATLTLSNTLSHIDTWVFDLDNTLYPADSDLWPKIDQRITLFLAHLFGLDGMSSAPCRNIIISVTARPCAA